MDEIYKLFGEHLIVDFSFGILLFWDKDFSFKYLNFKKIHEEEEF